MIEHWKNNSMNGACGMSFDGRGIEGRMYKHDNHCGLNTYFGLKRKDFDSQGGMPSSKVNQ